MTAVARRWRIEGALRRPRPRRLAAASIATAAAGSQSFQFQTTRSILAETGATQKLGELMSRMSCEKVLIVTDPGIEGAGLLSDGVKSLESAGIAVTVFNKVVNDPPESVVLDAVDESKGIGIDGVVGLGGGSAMDVAKLVAYLCAASQPLDTLYGVGNATSSNRLPLIQVPTTAGTGSEVTPISILTTGENEKKGVVDPVLLPDWALLDPLLTVSLPKHTTAATGIDAMVHAIEAFTSKIKKNQLSDAFAILALQKLCDNIHEVCKNPKNVDARLAMLTGSMYAGMAFANSPVAAVHALAYPIGSHFHVPHGLSNSLMLPHVLRFNAEDSTACAQYAQLARAVLDQKRTFGLNDREASDELVGYLTDLPAELGLESKLREVGISYEDIELLATESMKQTRLLPNNPRMVTLQDAKALYRLAY